MQGIVQPPSLTLTSHTPAVTGALVSGPAIDDTYNDVRADAAQSAVGLHHNIPLIGLLGGLVTSGITQGQCSSGQGLYQMLAVNVLP